MSKRRIKVSLSKSSIDDAIRYVQFMKRNLSINTSLFIGLLQEQGISVISSIIGEVPEKEKGNTTIGKSDIERLGGDRYKASIFISGDKILFIEFSAGITYGTDSFETLPNNPSYGSGYGMGTYNPDSDNWKNPDGWWYKDKNSGKYEKSLGNKAYAPMFNADKSMRDAIQLAARLAFGNGE